MIIKISGNLNPYYLQTLCMIFFPGAKFPENEPLTPETTVVTLSLTEEAGTVSAYAEIRRGEQISRGSAVREQNDALGDDDRIRKIAAGHAFMTAGQTFTGFTPPWGIMTGVRPAKLVSEYLAKGLSPEQAAEILKTEFFVTPVKADLAAKVAVAENALITPGSRRDCSVYVAIPFCPSRCAYCSFVSYTSPHLRALIPDYLHALAEDIDKTAGLIRECGLRVRSVYIGGGTPTVLSADELRFLLPHIAPLAANAEEFTLEAGRPDTITAEKLSVAKEYGVTRISVNTQTLNEEILEKIGRKHTAAEFFTAFAAARASGIPEINIDLIAGLPGESAASFARTIDGILPLRAENVTVHTFCVKKSASLKTEADAGGEKSIPYDRDGIAAMEAVLYSQSALTAAGYAPYYMYRQKNTVGNLENVGYAMPGHEGLYNIYMMEEVHSIFACGASAVTKFVSQPDENGNVRIERIFEPKYPYEYLRANERENRFTALRDAALRFFGQAVNDPKGGVE